MAIGIDISPYHSNIFPDRSRLTVRSVFEAFGPITYCKLAYGASAHKHKGYGFIEYATLAAALEAIASMNLFDLGGQYLRVGRAITPPNALAGPPQPSAMPTAAAVAAAAATAKIQAMDAVASNAVALGLTKLNALGVSPAAALPSLAAALPTLPTLPTLPALPGLPLAPPALPAMPGLPAVLPAPALPAPALPPPGVVIPPGPASPPADGAAQAALQRKLLDTSPDTLQQQESLSISGQSARHLVMQRLMRRRASRTVLLCNMVEAAEVDEALHHEITEECSKWGKVERLVIYNERQSEDDDPAHADVKIFVQFNEPDGESVLGVRPSTLCYLYRIVTALTYTLCLYAVGQLVR